MQRVKLTVGLVSTIFTVEASVTSEIQAVALPVETLPKPEGGIAHVGATRYNYVRKYQETHVSVREDGK